MEIKYIEPSALHDEMLRLVDVHAQEYVFIGWYLRMIHMLYAEGVW